MVQLHAVLRSAQSNEYILYYESHLLIFKHRGAVCMTTRVRNKRSLAVFCDEVFSSPSYYVWGTLVNVQNFDFGFLADLHRVATIMEIREIMEKSGNLIILEKSWKTQGIS